MARLVRRVGDDKFQLRIREQERDVLRSLMMQMRDLITERDSTAWRLFPNAYQDDPKMAAEYEEMVGEELRDKRLEAIETVESTLDETLLDESQLNAWMGAVNDLRLVLGTRLDVNEESTMRDYNTNTAKSLFSAYSYLGVLLEEIVASLID